MFFWVIESDMKKWATDRLMDEWQNIHLLGVGRPKGDFRKYRRWSDVPSFNVYKVTGEIIFLINIISIILAYLHDEIETYLWLWIDVHRMLFSLIINVKAVATYNRCILGFKAALSLMFCCTFDV